MSAFVTNGPDIPEKLLQAHEEGRVVFFCGAGISYPAGLPGFGGLVKDIYGKLKSSPNSVQKSAIKSKQYDTAIGLLETDIVGGRESVRRKLVEILTPGLITQKSIATHESLLTLARNRDGRIRLITTNFDRLFEEVISDRILTVKCFSAPLLPVPKNRWNGLVYLHGLLPAEPTADELDQLVISSGDYGLAYLTERWAARFVSELFRNYTVCFIGYSINDPVLRYMMDALAADRLLGETPPEMYAFGSYSKGKKCQIANEWYAKNVTPLLYREYNKHTYLHRTLQTWAKTYRDGVSGKKMIIAQHSTTSPFGTSRSDFAIRRVLWALTDKDAAKNFAEINPVPPLEWLKPLAKNQFKHEDLTRFGVNRNAETDKYLQFSVIHRPAPYTHSRWMHIADMGDNGSNLDEVMFQLARWLTRHLNDPKLIIWLAKQGGQLHEQFANLIRDGIEYLDKLDSEGKQEELDGILLHAPKAIPGLPMRTLWRIFLSGRIKSHAQDFNLYNWFGRFKQVGLTLLLRMELREILTPKITILEPFYWKDESDGVRVPEQITDIVEWELVLSSDNVHSALREEGNGKNWQTALPELLQDFTTLLRDALDLKKELGGADEKSDLSYVDQPSISKHSQNKNFQGWTALIKLACDSWLSMVQVNPTQARLVAESWWQFPYPLFKRLSFFAATSTDLINSNDALDWLLSDEHRWLWSDETKREMFRLLMSLAPKLNAPGIAELGQSILDGPPREIFRDDIDPDRYQLIVDREIWLRLEKLKSTGVTLDPIAKSKLDELSQQNPKWQLATDERDEFPFWMSKGDEWTKPMTSPCDHEELVKWLKQPSDDFGQNDGWRQRCRDDFPSASKALRELAQNDEWPTKRWREALQAWSDGELLRESWHGIPDTLEKAPNNVINDLSHNISRWLQAQAEVFDRNEKLFFSLNLRILSLRYEDGAGIDDDPVFSAINHPVGLVTQALLNWWYLQDVNDSEGLGDQIKPIFTELCNTQKREFRHGRVLLAAHVISLFLADEEWTKLHLLPLFDWQNSDIDSRAAWEGFLWSPRFYLPLFSIIKNYFLDTASHYGELGKHAKQFAAFLAFVALDPGDTFTIKELAGATSQLPTEGLESSAQALIIALTGAGEQRSEYWKNRILPYLESIWPNSRNLSTPQISSHFGRLCIEAEKEFPAAVANMRHWLKPIMYPNFLVHLLNHKKLCEQFPVDSLTFLDAIISDSVQQVPNDLRQCLDDIKSTDDTLVNEPRFARLDKLCPEMNPT